jgi:predicted metalloprotease with PDZ domain
MGVALVSETSDDPWLGWQLEVATQGLTARRILRDSPAEQAGLMVGDELIALAGQRVRRPEDVAAVLAARTATAPVTAVLARDARIFTVELMPAPPRVKSWRLEVDAAAPPEVGERRRRWLALELP